jgi:hypothetical protein
LAGILPEIVVEKLREKQKSPGFRATEPDAPAT